VVSQHTPSTHKLEAHTAGSVQSAPLGFGVLVAVGVIVGVRVGVRVGVLVRVGVGVQLGCTAPPQPTHVRGGNGPQTAGALQVNPGPGGPPQQGSPMSPQATHSPALQAMPAPMQEFTIGI